MRISDLLYNSNINSNKILIIDDNAEWTYYQICQKVNEISLSLQKSGVKYRDRVAIIYENGALFVCAMFAVTQLGAIVVPINISSPKYQTEKMLNIAEVKFICTSLSQSEFLGFSVVENNGATTILTNNQNFDNSGVDGDTCLILFSSGTSGEPKGIVLSHNAILNNVYSIIDYMGPSCEDVFYIAKSMVHISTITGEILVAFHVGARLIAQKTVITPNIVIQRIQRHKVTIIVANPTIFRLIIGSINGKKIDFSSVRLIYSCAASINGETMNRLEKIFYNANVYNVYGLTEAGPRVTAQKQNTTTEKISVGTPLSNVEIKIMYETEVVVPNVTGTIWVKTNAKMSGYYKNTNATREVISGEWLITGDLGHYDENFHLHIDGRVDDIFTRGGHNINPIYIENVLKEQLNIDECVVFGITHEIFGHKIVCAIQNKGCIINSKDVNRVCQIYLMQHEKPDEIYFWDKIPVSSSGKISRLLAQEYYLSQANNI